LVLAISPKLPDIILANSTTFRC